MSTEQHDYEEDEVNLNQDDWEYEGHPEDQDE